MYMYLNAWPDLKLATMRGQITYTLKLQWWCSCLTAFTVAVHKVFNINSIVISLHNFAAAT